MVPSVECDVTNADHDIFQDFFVGQKGEISTSTDYYFESTRIKHNGKVTKFDGNTKHEGTVQAVVVFN